MITQARLKEVAIYDAETGQFVWSTNRGGFVQRGRVCGCVVNGYVSIAIDGKRHKAHRLAWLYVYGVWPKEEIDHIDGDKSNNRIANLREASHSENLQNQRIAIRSSSSGLIGASFYKRTGKWASVIKVDGKARHLGYFDTAIDAHKAYVNSKRAIHPFGML